MGSGKPSCCGPTVDLKPLMLTCCEPPKAQNSEEK